mmetsp:Transcript_4375/g.6162  ORF Transcript_4375/g.6162 Transcript_4375/m.6162 type:complete len:177 (+) Transcript_4375:71-601(+)
MPSSQSSKRGMKTSFSSSKSCTFSGISQNLASLIVKRSSSSTLSSSSSSNDNQNSSKHSMSSSTTVEDISKDLILRYNSCVNEEDQSDDSNNNTSSNDNSNNNNNNSSFSSISSPLSSPTPGIKVVLAIAGVGSTAISTLASTPGASSVLLEGRLLYDRCSIVDFLSSHPLPSSER